ncbi:hypothetical protein FS749_001011 [Ceratobasidium sp. UAMH 11750]|nr:hypothetical protein FS749_001011 [Ceratobasidium sp. UAMH 11750]
MPRYSKKNEDDVDMTLVLHQPGGSYKCTICPTFADVQNLSHLRKHLAGKAHLKHVVYHQRRELESRDTSQQSTSALPQQLLDIEDSVMDLPHEGVTEASADDSASVSSTTSSIAPCSTAPPLPPPLPSQPPPPTYNFFDDYVYQDFDDDLVAPETIGHDLQNLPGFGPTNAWTTDGSHVKPPNYPSPASDLWLPFPDKAHYLTYSLFNTSHIRFSRPQQEAILDWAREMGMSPVPTLYSLQSCQAELTKLSGIGPRMFKTDSGHMYYVNSLDDMLKQDFPNLHVRKHMKFYPSDGRGPCTEFWDANELAHGENLSQLTPMASNGNKTYFVHGHALREKAQGRPVYSIPFVLFVDDVSGNVSKQWNKHWCCYLSNALFRVQK